MRAGTLCTDGVSARSYDSFTRRSRLPAPLWPFVICDPPWELQSLGGRPSLSPSEEDRETLRRARLLRGTHGQEEAWKGFVEVEGGNLRPKPHSRCQVSPGQLDQADAAWNEGMRFSGGYPLNCTLDSVF